MVTLDRNGSKVCEGEIINVRLTKKGDHTALVTVAIPKEYAEKVCNIKRCSLYSDGEEEQK